MSIQRINNNSIVVLGASPNPNRTSYLAAKVLVQKGYDVEAYGNKIGAIDQLSISDAIPTSKNQSIDAITIFLKPQRQKKYYDYILGTNPKRIIFNPGTENPELIRLAKLRNINIISCCTIALSAVGML
jgi:predicted CoA-binding protein